MYVDRINSMMGVSKSNSFWRGGSHLIIRTASKSNQNRSIHCTSTGAIWCGAKPLDSRSYAYYN